INSKEISSSVFYRQNELAVGVGKYDLVGNRECGTSNRFIVFIHDSACNNELAEFKVIGRIQPVATTLQECRSVGCVPDRSCRGDEAASIQDDAAERLEPHA